MFDPTTRLCLKDVTFIPNIESPDYMLVSIKRSKTDTFRNGCNLTLARSTISICVVMAMKDYVLQRQPPSAGLHLYQWQVAHLLSSYSRTPCCPAAMWHIASPQTSFGVRLSRIHFSPRTSAKQSRLLRSGLFE